MKEQTLKIKQPPKNTPSVQQLLLLTKKYYLPYLVQVEKDTTIIHYQPSIKQIIYNQNSYILHRQKQPLYQMNG
jgi:hypothetical protein